MDLRKLQSEMPDNGVDDDKPYQLYIILSFEMMFRVAGLTLSFFLLKWSRIKIKEIINPSVWKVNYDETYCTISLALVKMCRFQLYLLILIFFVGMCLDIYQFNLKFNDIVNILLWVQ